ncbi:MAG: 30S ribosomal protein S17 [Chloroflexi bacterium]|nr:30S ribosomal protein S17 [Chloroflexota bacterium]
MEQKRKTRVGHVARNKMNKTVVVAVESTRHHPLYKKTIRRMVKYKAHDETNACREGDLVKIEETRPLSRDKRWRVAEILTKAGIMEAKPKEIDQAVGTEQ